MLWIIQEQLDFASLTITDAYNHSDDTVIKVANFTVSGTGFTNATVLNWNNVSVSYTYVYTGVDTEYQNVSDRMATNFTEGIDNVSGKIPVILLIGAVVLLFGVIILLVRRSGELGIGSKGASL
jgi:hypothetical protein